MANIEISKKEINRLLKKEYTTESLVKTIEMLGIPVDSVEQDKMLLEINPNRPDFLSQYGIARALKSFLGTKKGFIDYESKKSDYKVIIDPKLKLIRPYTACCVVKNIDFDDQKIKDIIQFQEKLHVTLCRNRKKAAIGIYPLDKIKFPVYFKAMNPEDIKFQPLDYGEKLDGNKILSENETGKKYADLLKDFKQFPVFIDSNKNIMSMPPIINSDSIGKITTKTKDVFIEVSGFDIDFLKQVLNLIATDLADMGGTIYSVEVSAYAKKLKLPELTTNKMKVDINYSNKLLGITLKETEVKLLLEKMGFDYNKGIVIVPCYRLDVIHQFDLVEDIAIAYGYDNFEPKLESFYSTAEETKDSKLIDKLKDLMIGHGFLEVSMPHLTNNNKMNAKMNTSIPYVNLKNSINQDYNILRSWLIPGLMEIIGANKHNEYPQDLFEIGKIFSKDGEEMILSGVIAHGKANFTEAKQLMEFLLKTLKVDYQIRERKDPLCFIEGRVAQIMVSGKEIGYFGEIYPSVLSNWQIEVPVAAFEIEFNQLKEAMKF